MPIDTTKDLFLNRSEAPKALEELNQSLRFLPPAERLSWFYEQVAAEDVLFTSSFGTTSATLLELFDQVGVKQKVHFIDTGYHFPATWDYKSRLEQRYLLDVVSLRPESWKHAFTQQDQTWKKDPDFCCSVNKVEPLAKVKKNYAYWISGLMAFQNPFRKGLNILEWKDQALKFYPLIDQDQDWLTNFWQAHQLPAHPLEKEGFGSIGCAQCTRKGQGRSGRWAGTSKLECGLHR